MRLEPLGLIHHAALCEVGLEEIWGWNSSVRMPEEMRN